MNLTNEKLCFIYDETLKLPNPSVSGMGKWNGSSVHILTISHHFIFSILIVNFALSLSHILTATVLATVRQSS